MKKIIFSIALLGSFYFANAQVGVGTSTPSTSSMLDVVSDSKGVLVPRVELDDAETVLAGGVTQENGLLVYNTATIATEGKQVAPGFYYWTNTSTNPSTSGKWNRIINATDLNNVIVNQADITKIKALLNTAYGSNNLGAAPTTGTFGGMVFTPADGSTPAKFEYVKFEGGNYSKVDITTVITDLIESTEAKTTIVTYENKQYYLSEAYIQAGGSVDATSWTSVPAGAILIDVVSSVVKNFQSILNGTTTIVKTPADGSNPATYYTVEEYIEYLSQNALPVGVTKVVLDGSNQASFQQWDGDSWEPVANTAFSTIVKANETFTTIAQSKDGAAYAQLTLDLKAADKIVYEYSTENNSIKNYIDVTEDIKWSINNNEALQNIIKKIVNSGGSVYYNATEIVAGSGNGVKDGAALPANSLYTIEYTTDGDTITELKVPIDISGAIVNATTINDNSTTIQKNNVTKIKQNLGSKYTTNNTSVFTGDTIVEGGITYYIYKGTFTTTVTKDTANTTGVTLDKAAYRILDLQLKYNGGMSAGVTNLSIDTAKTGLSFKIGTGSMYYVLSTTGNLDAEVIIEFASTVSPLL